MNRIYQFICAGILLAMNLSLTSSCSSAAKNDDRDEDSLTVRIEDNGYEYSLIYDSENARNAPAFKDGKMGVPLSVQDSRKRTLVAIDTDDISCSIENGVLTYCLCLLNTTDDQVEIESIEFPDTRFKARVGCPVYSSGLLSWIKLETDSPVNIKDYRVIINYKGDKYPPETVHVNLHPDKESADKAYDERISKQEK